MGNRYWGDKMYKKISIIEKGPLRVQGFNYIKKANNVKIHISQDVFLCRCGKSENKPFCDGSHILEEFNDEIDKNLTSNDLKEYVGEKITIFFNDKICSHRGICYELQPDVFTGKDILPNDGNVEKIIEACKKCPSGALSYKLTNGVRNQVGEKKIKEIQLAKRQYGFDGPYEISGNIKLENSKNRPETEDHYVLCRCGKSKNMPFCSGEHWKAKFIDENNDDKEE